MNNHEFLAHEPITIPSSSVAEQVSESLIKPKYVPEESKQPIYLAPLDLTMLSGHYIQKGLLFRKPDGIHVPAFLERLKDSLALTITHFYPLAGQLATQKDEHEHSSLIFLDSNKGPGARFIHAIADMALSDILSPRYVPRFINSFFDHDRAVNYDGHFRPLLSVQVTELTDGIFIGCSMNHVAADGTSYWHFLNAWSEIHGADGKHTSISRVPIHKRWFPDGVSPIIKLPFAHPDEFISRYEAPELTERIFNFSSESISELKAKANAQCGGKGISSLQALSALAWGSITRARSPPSDQKTACKLAVDNRQRLNPPLSQDYFGSFVQTVAGATTVGELLDGDIGSAAMLLHKAVNDHDDRIVRYTYKKWMETYFIYQIGSYFDPYSVMVGGSPRYDVYSNEFGLGKAVAVLSGYNDKFDGKMVPYPGSKGGGSVDLQISLSPASMAALESDAEFMNAVTSAPQK